MPELLQKLVTIHRGHDPRDLTMVVSGGDAAVPAPVYSRNRLPAHARFDGPALVDEPTTVILPGQRVRLDRFGLIPIEDIR